MAHSVARLTSIIKQWRILTSAGCIRTTMLNFLDGRPRHHLVQMMAKVPTSFQRRFSTKVATGNAYSFKTKSVVNTYKILENGRIVEFTWDDGVSSKFHALLLRFSCQCHECRHDDSNQCRIDVISVPQPITISNVTITDTGVVELRWTEDGHCGAIQQDFLRWYRYDKKALEEKNDAVRPLFLREVRETEIPFTELSTEQGIYRWIKTIADYGICLLKGVPTEEKYVKKVTEMIGPVQETIYGEFFDVINTPKANNLAYTSHRLQFHMDLLFYENAPGIQLLHCIQFDDSVVGGESIFVDAVDVAEELRSQDPSSFDTLVRLPSLFERIHRGRNVFMQYQCPHIRLNNRNEIIEVRWHPGLNGPVPYQDFDDVEEYYRAYLAMAKLLNKSQSRKEFRLRPGDLICYNNRRYMHGRNEFENTGSGKRFLQGSYATLDDFRSRIQDLLYRVGDGSRVRRLGNGSYE